MPNKLFLFSFENGTVCRIIWKNTVESGRPQTAIWHMRIACWIPKATNTHSQYVILTVLPLLLWLEDVPQCYVVCTLPVFLFVVNSNFGIENSGVN